MWPNRDEVAQIQLDRGSIGVVCIPLGSFGICLVLGGIREAQGKRLCAAGPLAGRSRGADARRSQASVGLDRLWLHPETLGQDPKCISVRSLNLVALDPRDGLGIESGEVTARDSLREA